MMTIAETISLFYNQRHRQRHVILKDDAAPPISGAATNLQTCGRPPYRARIFV
jgi:hypothetical protein